MAQILDGHCDFDNVFPEEIARHNMSMYGTGDYVLQIGECLGYELVSNNEIQIKDGMFITQGRRGYVKSGTTDKCIIENVAQSLKRHDIVVIEYSKDESTMLESHTTKIIKGVAAEEADDPEIVTGDINSGATLHQMPLYRIKINGLNVESVEQLFKIGSVAAETVDPMLATEGGFAADAYKTKLQFDEQNKNIQRSENNIVDLINKLNTASNTIADLINNPVIKTQDITVNLGVLNKNGFRSVPISPNTPNGYTLIGALCRSADQSISTNLCIQNGNLAVTGQGHYDGANGDNTQVTLIYRKK